MPDSNNNKPKLVPLHKRTSWKQWCRGVDHMKYSDWENMDELERESFAFALDEVLK